MTENKRKKALQKKLKFESAQNSNKMILLSLGACLVGISVSMFYFPEFFSFLTGNKKDDDDDDDDPVIIIPEEEDNTTYHYQGYVDYIKYDGNVYYAKVTVNSSTKLATLVIYNSKPEIVFGPINKTLTKVPEEIGGGVKPGQLKAWINDDIEIHWFLKLKIVDVIINASVSSTIPGDTPPPVIVIQPSDFPVAGLWRSKMFLDINGMPTYSTVLMKSDKTFTFFDYEDSAEIENITFLAPGSFTVPGREYRSFYEFHYDVGAQKIVYTSVIDQRPISLTLQVP